MRKNLGCRQESLQPPLNIEKSEKMTPIGNSNGAKNRYNVGIGRMGLDGLWLHYAVQQRANR